MQDADMTGFNRSYKNIKWLTILLMVVAVAGAGICCPTRGSAEPAGIKTVVIDPGHGGYDHGARGPAGSLEKSVIFQLAQILAAALAPDCQVVWTRTGDYQVALTRRASVANHHKADLFISLHAGGSPMPGGNAWSVFYFSDPNRNAALVPEPKFQENVLTERGLGVAVPWGLTDARLQQESRILAECVKSQLAGSPDIGEIMVSAAALRVLEGLEMPAIVVETGTLANSGTEKQLTDPAFLTDIAGRIKQGVDVYLTR